MVSPWVVRPVMVTASSWASVVGGCSASSWQAAAYPTTDSSRYPRTGELICGRHSRFSARSSSFAVTRRRLGTSQRTVRSVMVARRPPSEILGCAPARSGTGPDEVEPLSASASFTLPGAGLDDVVRLGGIHRRIAEELAHQEPADQPAALRRRDAAGCPGGSVCSLAGAAGSRVRTRVTPAMRSVPPGLGAAVGDGLGDVGARGRFGAAAAAARRCRKGYGEHDVPTALPTSRAIDAGYGLRVSRCRGLRPCTGSALVQQTEADDRGEPDQADGDGEPVEVLLDDRRSAER